MLRPASRFILERNGLAAAELQGVVRAGRFAEPERRVGAAFSAPLRRQSGPAAEQDDQLLLGERFDVLDAADGYALGQIRRTGYVGYVLEAALAPAPDEAPTHRIASLRAFAYAEPDFKAPATGPIPFGALVRIEAESTRYAKAADVGWIAMAQLTPVGTFEPEPAAVAERFLGSPYLWGARDGIGIDCSGLVHQALSACGRACPRDTDLQAQLGGAIDAGGLRRGDLVAWRGHVGMMVDEARLIHANTRHMAVAIEPLAEAIAFIRERTGEDPTSYRRL